MIITKVSKEQFKVMWLNSRDLPGVTNSISVDGIDIVYDYLMSGTEDVDISIDTMPWFINGYIEYDANEYLHVEEYEDYIYGVQGVAFHTLMNMKSHELTELILTHPECIGTYKSESGINKFVFRL